MVSRGLCILIAGILFCGSAFAVSEATFLFLTLPPSPQANGMAGVYTSMGNDDPLAPFSVPSVMGLMGEYTKVQVAFYPERTNWLPQFDIDDLTYATRSAFVGFNREWVKQYFGVEAPISFGFGYYEVDLDLGETVRTDAQGNVIGTFHSWENAKALGAGIGWHAKKWQAGFGFLHKWGHSDLSPVGSGQEPGSGDADAFATDLGLLLRAPLQEWIYNRDALLTRPPVILPFFTPEVGYSLLNFGGEVAYVDRAQADPLPRTGKLHFGVSCGLDAAAQGFYRPLRLLEINWGRTTEDILLGRDNYGDTFYRGLFADIKPLSDLLGNSNGNVVMRTGWGVNFFESFQFRQGRSEDPDGRVYLDYEGYGYQASGLFMLLSGIPFIKKHRTITYLLRHIDIQYHHSTRNIDYGSQSSYYYDNHPLDNTKDEQISLYFRY